MENSKSKLNGLVEFSIIPKYVMCLSPSTPSGFKTIYFIVVIAWNLKKILFFFKAGPADLRHFDPEFTQETVPSSIIQTPDLATSSSSATDAFLGFSYAPNDDD